MDNKTRQKSLECELQHLGFTDIVYNLPECLVEGELERIKRHRPIEQYVIVCTDNKADIYITEKDFGKYKKGI